MAKPRGWLSVGVLERYVSLPVAGSTPSVPIELLVRSAAYRNLPSGVRCRSDAQMSLSTLRPGEGRGAPGCQTLRTLEA